MVKGIAAISRLFLTVPINPVEWVFPLQKETGQSPAFKIYIPDTWQVESAEPAVMRLYPPDLPVFLTIRETAPDEFCTGINQPASLDVFSISDTGQGNINGLLHTSVLGQGKTSSGVPVTFILNQFSTDNGRSFSLLFVGKRKAVIQYLKEFIFIRNSIAGYKGLDNIPGLRFSQGKAE